MTERRLRERDRERGREIKRERGRREKGKGGGRGEGEREWDRSGERKREWKRERRWVSEWERMKVCVSWGSSLCMLVQGKREWGNEGWMAKKGRREGEKKCLGMLGEGEREEGNGELTGFWPIRFSWIVYQIQITLKIWIWLRSPIHLHFLDCWSDPIRPSDPFGF
jgi:hypothetical protein